MKHEVATQNAPQAIGPYSQAIRFRDLLFLSGQIGLDPATGQLVSGGVGAEARQVMENLKAVLAAAGAPMIHVLRTTIYLVDMNDFATVNEIYGNFIQRPYPARSTVAVAALPRGARVEIDAIAQLD